ncbi:MAG TPA: DNA N-6-adenine-methyltransferase [Candidatus Obscuribacterales bacterium]
MSTGSKSKQDYGTPEDFIRAVQRHVGKIGFDLAASAHNKKHARYYAMLDLLEPDWGAMGFDSLAQDWGIAPMARATGEKVLWLNPPFKQITPWARKCAETLPDLGSDLIAFLVPAAVGSNWFRDYVYGKAAVLFLNGRIKFEGSTDPFPKDLMLCVYGWKPGCHIWQWWK